MSLIDDKEMDNAKKIMRKHGPPNRPVIDCEHFRIQRRSYKTLLPKGWLNDEIINAYMKVLTINNEKSLAFSSFFFTVLLRDNDDYQYDSVKDWGQDIFAKDHILVPVNIQNMHWALLSVSIPKKCISYYDSLGASGSEYLDAMLHYLQDKANDGNNIEFKKEEWSLQDHRKTIPQQLNGYDCGVFVCVFGYFILNNLPLTFTQDDITEGSSRDVISYCLLKNRILNPILNTGGEEVNAETNKTSVVFNVEEPDTLKAKVKMEEPDVPKVKVKVEEQTDKVKVEEPIKSECFEPNYSKIVSVIKNPCSKVKTRKRVC